MTTPAVKPELGPTLSELLAPLPRAVRYGLAALVGVAAVALLVVQLDRGREVTRAFVERPVAFSVAVPDGLERTEPSRGAALRLATRPEAPARQSFVVAPLRLPLYAGDPTAAMMDSAARRVEALRRFLPGFVLRQEGRTRVNEQPGYQVLFQFSDGGRTAYGRVLLLVPSEEDVAQPREGAVLELRSRRTPAVPSVGALGSSGPLKTALRSFRLGTGEP